MRSCSFEMAFSPGRRSCAKPSSSISPDPITSPYHCSSINTKSSARASMPPLWRARGGRRLRLIRPPGETSDYFLTGRRVRAERKVCLQPPRWSFGADGASLFLNNKYRSLSVDAGNKWPSRRGNRSTVPQTGRLER